MPLHKKELPFKVTLNINNENLTASGESVFEALQQIHPKTFYTRGIFTVEKDGKKVEKLVFIRQLKKLFGFKGMPGNKINQQVFAKLFTLSLQ
jgi:hypothetical protein